MLPALVTNSVRNNFVAWKLAGGEKAILLAALYLCQNAPKGYLAFLPILMREKNESLKNIARLALLTYPELLKPVFAMFMDSKMFASAEARKKTILLMQFFLISMFVAFSFRESPTKNQLFYLITATSFLTAILDTAVDGLAVIILTPQQQSLGGFGQYFGYRFGGLLTGGLLPYLFGTDNFSFCVSTVVVMSVVSLLTLSSNVAVMSQDNPQPDVTTREPFLDAFPRLLRKYLFSRTGINITLICILYKLGEFAMDFVWSSMLVDRGIDRKSIIKTQFLIGNLAAIGGAVVGSRVTNHLRVKGYSSVAAVSVCSIFRLFSEILQIMFAYSSHPLFSTSTFVATHAIVENVAGSALTASMFNFLLAYSDEEFPATSYAYLNSLALLGMSLGNYLTGYATDYTKFCILAFTANIVFTVWTGVLAVGGNAHPEKALEAGDKKQD